MLAVLKWFLASLKAQQYAGRQPSEGVKKPLNAFLGEVFTGACGTESDPTILVSEQVSHHPPVTACYLFNDKAGVRAEGYTRQEITFSGSVNIQQIGHAVMHLDRWEEDYLIPLPNVTVKGILTAGPYPELSDHVRIVSSTGYVAEIDFTGKKMLGMGGRKNHVEGGIYEIDDSKRKDALYTVDGCWSESFTFRDASGKDIDTYDVSTAPSADFVTRPVEQQDPWESRKAWDGVISAIHKSDMKGVAQHKDELESAQREMRKKSETAEENWQAVYFRKEGSDPVAEKLMQAVGQKLDVGGTVGCWKFDQGAVEKVRRQGSLRGGLTPFR